MGGEVQISKRAQELIHAYLEACSPASMLTQEEEFTIDFDILVFWLKAGMVSKHNSKKSQQEMDFLLAKIRAELLRDLNEFITVPRKKLIKERKEAPSSKNKILFVVLAISGTIVAACEGFDSVSTMMGVLSIPSWTILLGGLIFSLLSVIVFYGFELAQVSKSLGVNLTDAPKLLDIYLSQLDEIKSIRRKINTYSLSGKTPAELAELNQVVAMLNARFTELSQVSKQFKISLETDAMKWAKYIFSGLAALLFFGSGFFAGQSVGIFIAGFFIASATPAMWPVVLVSLLVGCAAFNLYWFWERYSLETLISGWFGLDEDKINYLCDEDRLSKEEEMLNNLSEKIADASHVTSRMHALEHESQLTDTPGDWIQSEKRKPVDKHNVSSIYSFFYVAIEAIEPSESCPDYAVCTNF